MSSFCIVRVPIMKVAKIQALLMTVMAINLLSLHMTRASKCYATEEVQALSNLIYRSAYNGQVPQMTDEQWRKIVFLYSAYNQTKTNFQDQITKLMRELSDEFGKPSPEKSDVIAKQDEINQIIPKVTSLVYFCRLSL